MNNAALLIMDMQAGILVNYPNAKQLFEKAAVAIAHALKNNIPVIYVVVGFRKGQPEASASNKMFSNIRERMANVSPEQWMKIDDIIQPQDNEIVVVKRRVSAFTGSDLEVVLRAQNIRHLVLAGISTSGVVLSTTREAADKDFQITILADACADGDPEVHKVLTEKVFPRQAEVLNIADWTNK